MFDYARRKEQELNESNGNNENLQAQIDSLKKKIRELEVCFSAPFSSSLYLVCPWRRIAVAFARCNKCCMYSHETT